MPERKSYAIELWKLGYAPELILSVGRFEWRAVCKLGSSINDKLKRLVERTPPPRRHFFIALTDQAVDCSLVKIGRFGTHSEAQSLATLVETKGYQSMMIVSSAVHLRRIAWALGQALRGSPIPVCYVAVPDHVASQTRQEWWKRTDERYSVLREFCKYLFYRLRF